MDKFTLFKEDAIIDSIDKLNKLYPDYLVSNDMEIISDFDEKEKTINIINLSAKHNIFDGFVIKESEIINSAFSGSRFLNFTFLNDKIKGNSFVCSNFESFKLLSTELFEYSSNNFSQSSFENCYFKNSIFVSSTWLNSTIYNSIFENCEIKSCTLEGTTFRKCKIKNTNMANANLDYLILDNSVLDSVTFSFYQFAYIIGAADYLNNHSSSNLIQFKAGEKIVSLDEFKNCITDLICYYYSKGEYFPACNLLLSIGDINNSKKLIVLGVHNSLLKNDFRIIKHFCRLGKFYSLFDYDLTNLIKNEINSYLGQTEFTAEELNQALIKTSEINMILNDKATGKTSLQFEIQTNIDRLDDNHQTQIEELVSNCRYILQNPIFKIEGHTISEVSYCPVTLILTVIGQVANLITIAGALQQFFSYVRTKNTKSPRTVAKNICKQYENIEQVDVKTRISLAKSEIEKSMLELRTYRGVKSGKRYEDFINSITQKIVGDVEHILDKDMLVFKIDS